MLRSSVTGEFRLRRIVEVEMAASCPWVADSMKTGACGDRRVRAGSEEGQINTLLGETDFRYNNRYNPYIFRDTLIKLLKAESLTYAELID